MVIRARNGPLNPPLLTRIWVRPPWFDFSSGLATVMSRAWLIRVMISFINRAVTVCPGATGGIMGASR
jgi:hypothetical protein